MSSPTISTIQIHEDLPAYDVIVAGGGLAGVGAACMSAQTGAKTLLVERLEVLGGLGTAGGVGNFCFGDDSLPHGQGKVFDDIWSGLAAYEAIGEENGWRVNKSAIFFNHTFDHNVLAIVLQELAEKYGVDLLFATDAIGVETKNGTARSILLHNRSLCQRCRAKVFIDCTGDGILSRHAGAHALAPEPEHPQSIPPSHMVFLQKSDSATQQKVFHHTTDNKPAYSIWNEPNRIGLKTKWTEKDFDTSTGQGYSKAGMDFRRRIPEFVRHFQDNDKGKDYVFAYSAPMFGLRDGVRIECDHVVSENDLMNSGKFNDAIAHGCFPFDSACLKLEYIPPYQIPYRSLLVKYLENLLVAGRCFSATRVALSSARIMATCCLMGQAAGIAAGLSSIHDRKLREINPKDIRDKIISSSPHDKILRERLQGLNW